MSSVLRAIKGTSIYALIVLVTLAVLDAILFFALPDDVAARFPGYREGIYLVDVLGRGYPQDYFEAHPERGFDIKPTDVPRTDQVHHMDEYSYNVWSNRLGCFDKPFDKPQERFWHMAGDSIVWGHAKFEELMGTLLETYEGVEILQCGVTHTGQRHQFSKFLEIGKTVGRWPEKVLVFYSPTDAANDYLHPHTSARDGKLADIRMLDSENNPVDLDEGWFQQVKAEREAARPDTDGQPTSFSISRLLMQYSISAQLLNAALHGLNSHAPVITGRVPVLGEEPGLDWYEKYFVYKGKKLYDLHRLTYFQTLNGHLEYANFKYAEANKAVIKAWRDHALTNGYKLEFVLPHPGPSSVYDGDGATNFYKEFIDYLSSLGIKYYDLIEELKKRDIETDDLYWEEDIHMSGRGNRVVGKILSELL
ncbi:MAG: hypothetical protein HC850_01395 [Rhodomicrobium sp.]|nr:hypothetical protein [Rhodomicrobium sp.]